MQNILLKKIKSKFILIKVFDYIEENKKLQLFSYSKYFQEILGIKLFDYQQTYYNKKGIKFDDLNDFLSLKDQIKSDRTVYDHFNTNLLKDNLQSYLNKKNLNYDILKSYLIDYNRYYFNNNLNLEKKPKKSIDIYSPFFDDLIKNRCLDIFIIPIEIELIEKFQLYNDYREAFDKLNKFKSNTSVKINYKNANIISLIKDFHINFEFIKGLDMINIGSEKNINYDILFKNVFSFNNFGKNLIDLNLKIHDVWGKITDSNNFEKINSFQNLKALELNGFKFQNNFTLNLNNIMVLNLRNCSNIYLSKNNKLESLLLSNCNILENENLIKLENLEKCELLNYKNNQKYHKIFDFSSFIHLKILNCQTCDFIHLTDESSLENAHLETTNADYKNEKEFIEKIFKLKKIKEVNFDIYSLNLETISNININNSSLNKMHIGIKNEFENANFSGLISKFSNLSEFKIDLQAGEEYFNVNIKINENKNCKINKLCISGCGVHNIELCCGTYSKLLEIKFEENGNITNLKDVFPLFKENCQIIFNELNTFYFMNKDLSTEQVPFEVLNNLYNNLDKMPNLKALCIICFCNEMKNELYEKFIKKLLEMKLDSITLELHIFNEEGDFDRGDDYTLEELKEIYPLTLDNKEYNIMKYEEIE